MRNEKNFIVLVSVVMNIVDDIVGLMLKWLSVIGISMLFSFVVMLLISIVVVIIIDRLVWLKMRYVLVLISSLSEMLLVVVMCSLCSII